MSAAPQVRTPPARGAFAEVTEQSSASITDLDGERKAFQALRASAALAGCALHELSSGAYLLTRWGLARELPDLRAVAALLSQMTGGRP